MADSKKQKTGSLKTFLTGKTVDDVVGGEQIDLIQVKNTDNCAHALKVLGEKNFYSVAVFDQEKNAYCGFADIKGIVQKIIQLFAAKASVDETFADIQKASWTKENAAAIKKEFDSAELTCNSPWNPCSNTTNLVDVIQQLLKVDRMPVTKDGKVVTIVSKSTIMKYLKDNAAEYEGDAYLKQSLADGKLGTISGLLTAGENLRAIDAFAKMSKGGISHLALVGKDGGLTGNLSVKDIRYAADDFSKLLLPVNDYVNAIRRQPKKKDVHPASHADLADSIGRTLNRLVIIKIHRLYITKDGGRELIGVVSVGDVLGGICKNATC